MQDWKQDAHPARLEEILPDHVVRCRLSPRNCVIPEGQFGFCGVRQNRGGRLMTLNYGKSVHATEETIETEAVNHFSPGERILSMGNVGCMLNCSYCHNWKTSQAKYVSSGDIRYYSPEQVVDLAKRNNIRCISWTYNDPVVWHEFVRDTAALAQKAGMINLFKSAFYITPEAVEELLPVIDIFSISVKSMDPEYYKVFTKGRLEPVLEAVKQVHRAGKHVEVSTLMITDISDNDQTASALAKFVREELAPTVPVHFVRFHPDYKMRNKIRTPVHRLESAREVALRDGLEHVYLGNVFDTPYSDTVCKGCGQLLVTRYGLKARAVGLDSLGRCTACNRDAHFRGMDRERAPRTLCDLPAENFAYRTFDWHGDIRSLHLMVESHADTPSSFYVRPRYADGRQDQWTKMSLGANDSFRVIVSKSSPEEIGAEFALPPHLHSNLLEVFDRAHFPTVPVEQATAPNDISPLPIFQLMA